MPKMIYSGFSQYHCIYKVFPVIVIFKFTIVFAFIVIELSAPTILEVFNETTNAAYIRYSDEGSENKLGFVISSVQNLHPHKVIEVWKTLRMKKLTSLCI